MGTSLFSPVHLAVLLVVVLLLFGAKRLPEIGRSLGVGMREFKDSVTGITEATTIDTNAELPPPAAATPVAQPAAAPAAAPAVAPAPEAAAPAPVAAPEHESEPVS
jgi:sec-independent protein translocase protein TatA